MRTISRVVLGISVLVLMLLGIGPRTGAYRTLTVLSGSMAPSYRPGDVVVVRPADPRTLRAGDVLTYSIPVGDHAVVTHRITEIVEAGRSPVVRTRGDANDA